jgi:glycogen debranching enzyme
MPSATEEPAPLLHHIQAPASVLDERTRVLKHGDTFVVFDRYGDVKPGGLGEEGMYHEGTRYLSCFFLELEGDRPFFLDSTIRQDNDQLTVVLTNPDLERNGHPPAPMGTLMLELKKFLWQGACYQQLRIVNHGRTPVAARLTLHFHADFADIFEVRGTKRRARGVDLPAEVASDHAVLGYRGLDECVRRTHLRLSPAPTALGASFARLDLDLQPHQEVVHHLAIICEREPTPPHLLRYHEARAEADADLARSRSWSCHLRTTNALFNAWIDRAVSDLHMVATELPTGPYPYAGVPWFNTPFGRDGIITALQCLWLRPSLARGVLAYLASTQATAVIPEQDAEPGKILHETRSGEMAALGEIPFGLYYGSIDATPLFLLLAAAYHERTNDREFLAQLWPHLQAALAWIERYGDRDGDGFVEYLRQSPAGLYHQGWKDSSDAIFHADGAVAEPPIALCEVQGYVFAAWRAGATLARLFGHDHEAEHYARRAEELRRRFEEVFWCEELETYALALDSAKRPCRVRSSNPGQCLFTGIVSTDRAARVARTLLAPASFSGWGVRTIPVGEARYNPMSYHNGSVWPHDNSLIALGLARCGFGDQAVRLLDGMFEAGLLLDLHRMPELFCGFDQGARTGPVPYPVACSPQAWAAGSVFLLLQTCLGLGVNGALGRISFDRPRLPAAVNELRIHNLEVGGSSIDLLLRRHEQDVGVNVLRRDGPVEVVMVK